MSKAGARLDRRGAQILAHPTEYREDASLTLPPRMPLRVYTEQIWILAQRAKVVPGDRAVGSLIRYEQALRAQILRRLAQFQSAGRVTRLHRS